ncbi:uncharacterized protein LOC116306009 [Actinia tenebrosa]|uniref:Uncharacterized protein LOC116306009 n=1 Tax=Actinia tenebrosa TaxID=6105 RepID=A0A6P8IXJ4_ACTTE|nr:uncharacterized protein LOC116306009 [Actinia tenebrosa]XP_031571895.1 uncharacterized protein LOC116306009 [Actinia tenebrosa]
MSMSKAEKYLQQWNEVDRKTYISSTKDNLSFLASVVKYPSLIHGEHLPNAVRRYEMYWLPLCKKHGTMSCDEWAAPLDVAWVWYLHMLMPENYVNDCICLIGNAPNHALKSGKTLQAARQLTKELWDQSNVNKEPFDLDLDRSIDVQEYKPKLRHDFTRLSTKLRNFYYQVSLPHYQDEKFLDSATLRYVTHLSLQMKDPSLMLCPPVDVQLVMYSHQLNPIFYNYQITVMLGKIASPFDLLDSTDNLGRQCQIEEATKKIWTEAGLEYHKPGTLYRGDPSYLSITNSIDKKHIDRFAMLRQDYGISVTQIDLEDLDHHNYYLLVFVGSEGEEIYKEKIKLDEDKSSNNNFFSMDKENGVQYVQLEDFPSDKQKAKGKSKVSVFTHQMYSLLEDAPAQTEDQENSEDITTYTIGDGHSTLVQTNSSTSDTKTINVSLYKIDRTRLHSEKILIGKTDLDIFKHLEPKDFQPSPSKDEKKRKICVPLNFPRDGPHMRVTLSVSPIGCGHYVFQVSPEYGFAKFKHICSALSYPTLMLSLSTIIAPKTPSEVMTYPILNYRGEKAFVSRIVRSVATTDVFYAVEILDSKGNVAATSHLLPSNALPYKTDLASSRGCAYFSNYTAENAMLIRGQNDWGLCLGRKVPLPPRFGKGKSAVLAFKLFLLRDNTNCYCPVQKFKNSLYMLKVPSSLSDQQNMSYIYLHISDGKFVMSSGVTEVPEILALALSTLVLQYLFCDKDRDCWAIIDDEDADLFSIFQSSDNIGFAWDGKYNGGDGAQPLQRLQGRCGYLGSRLSQENLK